MSCKFSVVTTFNQSGYQRYGQRMIQTFLKNWPLSVQLIVYAEGVDVVEQAPNLCVLDLETVSPELMQFKSQWKHVPKANGDVSCDPVRSRRKDAGKGFKWDAVRFAHKVYAIFHCAQVIKSDWLIWMDADTVCHSPVALDVLEKLIPNNKDLCFLGRKGKYTECGLYAMNLKSQAIQNWLTDFQTNYDHAEDGIFKLEEWHDSFVFDFVRSKHKLSELDWSGHLVSGEGHPLINSEWGAYLDHLKGNRKDLGRSKPKDLQVTRSEAYWSQ